VSFLERTDPFYLSQMNTADYIETEKKLFGNGFYASAENSANRTALSPVVELLIAQREGKISPAIVNAEIEKLKTIDVRNDYQKYLYRNGNNFQNSVGLLGGTENIKWNVSVGHDRNLSASIGNDYQRLTLNQNSTFLFLDKKLEFNTGIYYANGKTNTNALATSTLGIANSLLYPYARLIDENGNHLSTNKNLRNSFTEDVAKRGFLNWNYSPLDELELANNLRIVKEYRLNTAVKYKFTSFLNADLLYQYTESSNNSINNQDVSSYYVRNLINTFSIINGDGSITRPIPIGNILDKSVNETKGNYFRAQLNFNKTWSDHNLTILSGTEIRDLHTIGNSQRLYGYNAETASSKTVDYLRNFTSSFNPASTTNLIPNVDALTELTDRYLSYYLNAGYDLLGRYRLSASGRIDKSNIFGVNTNQKGIPLWSVGAAYKISSEPFYHISWLPNLNLRMSYGYNGNVDKSLSAYVTAFYFGTSGSPINQPYAQIENPPNPELRWERVSTINLGFDFSLKRDIISGNIDLYWKRGKDLLGANAIAPSTGITSFIGNLASTSSNGIDIQISSKNLNAKFKWNTGLIFSFIKERVTDYGLSSPVSSYLQFMGTPMVGRPLYGLYAYKWAGLDPTNGDPLGYLDGTISKDYAKIITSAIPASLEYLGSARPTFFGTINNNINYKGFGISFNVTYKLGYYFRKNSVIYQNNLGLGANGDYELRWRNQGDENITFVPSIPLATNSNRDSFYTYANVLVQRGDHIRFQDLKISYSITPRKTFKQLTVYAYADNLGIIWKKNSFGIDPDYQYTQLQRSLSLGFRMNF